MLPEVQDETLKITESCANINEFVSRGLRYDFSNEGHREIVALPSDSAI